MMVNMTEAQDAELTEKAGKLGKGKPATLLILAGLEKRKAGGRNP